MINKISKFFKEIKKIYCRFCYVEIELLELKDGVEKFKKQVLSDMQKIAEHCDKRIAASEVDSDVLSEFKNYAVDSIRKLDEKTKTLDFMTIKKDSIQVVDEWVDEDVWDDEDDAYYSEYTFQDYLDGCEKNRKWIVDMRQKEIDSCRDTQVDLKDDE